MSSLWPGIPSFEDYIFAIQLSEMLKRIEETEDGRLALGVFYFFRCVCL